MEKSTKTLRLCLEITAPNTDNQLVPLGVSMNLGEVPEEGFQERYELLLQRIKPIELLAMAGLGLEETIREEDCKIISPEEYDQKYGDSVSEDDSPFNC